MAVIRSLGGDGYTDEASISLHPDWTGANGISAQLEAFLPNSQPGERWFRSPVQGGNPLSSTAGAVAGDEVEVSAVIRKSNDFPPVELLLLVLDGTEFLRVLASDPGDGSTVFDLTFTGTGTVTGAGADLTIDRNYYVTLRYRRETSLGANNGRIEVWAHDQLAFVVTDFAATVPSFTTASPLPRVQSSTFTRNIVLQDSWSSADGVAPVPQLVSDDGDLTETVIPTTYDTFYVAPVFPDFYLDELLATGDTTNFTLSPDFLTFTNAVSYMTIPANTAAYKSSGAWFWQTTMITGGGGGEDNAVGIAVPGSLPSGYLGQGSTQWGYYENGRVWNGGGSTQYTALSDGDVVDHYLDLDNLTYSLGINGGAPFQVATLVGGTTYTPVITNRNGESSSIAFDVADLTIPVPSGFSAFVIPSLAWDANNQHNSSATLSNDDKTALSDAGTVPANRLTILGTSDLEIPPGDGIYYWETTCDNRVLTAGWGVGVIDASDPPVGAPSEAMGTNASRLVHVAYSDSGYRANGTINASNGIGWTNGDVVRHLANRDTGVYSVARDGQPLHAFATLLDPAATYLPHFHSAAVGEQATLRTTSAEFTGAIPAGAVALGDPPPPSADGDLNVAQVSAEIVTGLAHVGSLDISNARAEIVTGLAHVGSLDVSHVRAEILTGLAHVGSLDISQISAQIVTQVGPEFFGLPPVAVPQEISAQFDDFCDDLRDYETYDEEVAIRDNLIELQSIAAELTTFQGIVETQKTQAFSITNPVPIETPQLIRSEIKSYQTERRTHTLINGRMDLVGDVALSVGEIVKITLTEPYTVDSLIPIGSDNNLVRDTEDQLAQLPFSLVLTVNAQELPVVMANSSGVYQQITHYTVNRWIENNLNVIYVWWDSVAGEARIAAGPMDSIGGLAGVDYPALESEFCVVDTLPLNSLPVAGNPTSGLIRNEAYEGQTVSQINALRGGIHEADLYSLIRIYVDATTGVAERQIKVIGAGDVEYFYNRSQFATPMLNPMPIVRTVGANIFRLIKRATENTPGELELVGTSEAFYPAVPCPPGYSPPPRGDARINRILTREAFPFPIKQGDQFVIIEGCDKRWVTCKGRFSNSVNFGGFPFLPGEDRLVQQVNFRRTAEI